MAKKDMDNKQQLSLIDKQLAELESPEDEGLKVWNKLSFNDKLLCALLFIVQFVAFWEGDFIYSFM
jgi:hypothetical protein